jgi:hypothetical protein
VREVSGLALGLRTARGPYTFTAPTVASTVTTIDTIGTILILLFMYLPLFAVVTIGLRGR